MHHEVIEEKSQDTVSMLHHRPPIEDLNEERTENVKGKNQSVYVEDHVSAKDNNNSLPKPEKMSRNQKATLVILVFVNAATNMSASILAPFYPLQASIRGVTGLMSGLVFSITAFAAFLFSPLFGKYVSLIGTKFLFISGLFAVGICNMCMGMLELVYDPTMFISLSLLIRFIEGCGMAALLTSDFTICIHCFASHINIVFGMLEMCCGIGMCLGPAIGGLIYSVGGFGMPFYVLGLFVMFFVPVSMFILPPVETEITLENKKNSNGSSLCTMVKNLDVLIILMVITLNAIMWVFLDPTLEPHLRQQFDLSVNDVSMIFLLIAVIYAASSPLCALILEHMERPYLFMLTGYLGMAISYIFLGPSPYLPFIPSTLWLMMLSLIVLAISISLNLIPTLHSLKIATSDSILSSSLNTNGLVAGMWNSAFYLGEAIGPVLAGGLTDELGFPRAASIMSLLSIILILIILIYLLKKKFRKKEQCEKSLVNHQVKYLTFI